MSYFSSAFVHATLFQYQPFGNLFCPHFVSDEYFGWLYSSNFNMYCATVISRAKFLEISKNTNVGYIAKYCKKNFKSGSLMSLISMLSDNLKLNFNQSALFNNADSLKIHGGVSLLEMRSYFKNSDKSDNELHDNYWGLVYKKHKRMSGQNKGKVLKLTMLSQENISAIMDFVDDDLLLQNKGYPIDLYVKVENKINFTTSYQWFSQKQANNTWDAFICKHQPYLSCYKSEIGNYIGCCKIAEYTVCIDVFQSDCKLPGEYPFGMMGTDLTVKSKCDCNVCNGTWNSWNQWSSTCGLSYRFRHKARNNDEDQNACQENPAKCCCEVEKLLKASCEHFASTQNPSQHENICQNNSTESMDPQGKLYCHCTTGFIGEFCEIKLKCPEIPCLNGKCDLKTNKCVCASGYSGVLCEIAPTPCSNFLCPNYSTCFEYDNVVRCACGLPIKSNSVDERCLIDSYIPYQCNPNTCNNRGTCNSIPFGFKCKCIHGITGRYCELSLSNCRNNPCQNGGECMQMNHRSYRCFCKYGYGGDFCEKKLFTCAENSCQNGGKCTSNYEGTKCVCPVAFTGKFCEKSIVGCKDNPCKNGGVCRKFHNEYNCLCLYNYGGPFCENTNVAQTEIIVSYLKLKRRKYIVQITLGSLAILICLFLLYFTKKKENERLAEGAANAKFFQFNETHTREFVDMGN